MRQLTNTGYSVFEDYTIDEHFWVVESQGTDSAGNIIRETIGRYRTAYTWDGQTYVIGTRWNPNQFGGVYRYDEEEFHPETASEMGARFDAEQWIATGYFGPHQVVIGPAI